MMFAPRDTDPVPFWVNPPVAVITPVDPLVKSPLFVMIVVPVTVSALFTVRAAPLKL